jgi:hypothetical protein
VSFFAGLIASPDVAKSPSLIKNKIQFEVDYEMEDAYLEHKILELRRNPDIPGFVNARRFCAAQGLNLRRWAVRNKDIFGIPVSMKMALLNMAR